MLPLLTSQKASSFEELKIPQQTQHFLYIQDLKKYQHANYKHFKMSSKPQNTGKPRLQDHGRTQHTHTTGQTDNIDNLNTVQTSHILFHQPQKFQSNGVDL